MLRPGLGTRPGLGANYWEIWWNFTATVLDPRHWDLLRPATRGSLTMFYPPGLNTASASRSEPFPTRVAPRVESFLWGKGHSARMTSHLPVLVLRTRGGLRLLREASNDRVRLRDVSSSTP